MHLTPHEQERLLIHVAADVAQRRRESGLLLNYPEVMALLAAYVSEQARAGRTVSEIMASGTQLIRRDEVMEGVPEMIEFVQMEATFPDGTKLVTLHDPIPKVDDTEIYPGKVEHPRPPHTPDCPVVCGDGTGESASSCCDGCEDEAAWYAGIKFNQALQTPAAGPTGADTTRIGRGRTKIRVKNESDRAVQVGSHYHFAEVNPGLKVKEIEIPTGVEWTGTDLATCPAARLRRLNIPAGTSLRFEPGDECCVELVDIQGKPPIVKGLRKGEPFTDDPGAVARA